MSSNSPNSKSFISSVVGNAFLVLVPASLIVMLGVVGFAFIRGIIKGDAKNTEETSAAVASATPAAAPAAAPATATAPAADAAPAPAAAASAEPAATIDPEVMALGKTSYALCAACHGPDGKGLQAGPTLMAPALAGSELLLGDPDKALLVVLKGIAKENMDFMGMMAPLASGLDDEKLAAVLTYVRNEWGNSASAVSVEAAAAARAKFADVDAPAGVKRGEIDQIVEAHK